MIYQFPACSKPWCKIWFKIYLQECTGDQPHINKSWYANGSYSNESDLFSECVLIAETINLSRLSFHKYPTPDLPSAVCDSEQHTWNIESGVLYSDAHRDGLWSLNDFVNILLAQIRRLWSSGPFLGNTGAQVMWATWFRAWTMCTTSDYFMSTSI
jgi:hypothetical protein